MAAHGRFWRAAEKLANGARGATPTSRIARRLRKGRYPEDLHEPAAPASSQIRYYHRA